MERTPLTHGSPFWQRLLPILESLPDYGKRQWKSDLFAGLTVALVLIPQSMAYAQLAGLPAYYGLYAAFLPPTIAALFGSSRQLATGPVAVVSLMTAVALQPLAAGGSPAFIGYAALLSLMVGLLQFCLGILRLGLVVNFSIPPGGQRLYQRSRHHHRHGTALQAVRRCRGLGRQSSSDGGSRWCKPA